MAYGKTLEKARSWARHMTRRNGEHDTAYILRDPEGEGYHVAPESAVDALLEELGLEAEHDEERSGIVEVHERA